MLAARQVVKTSAHPVRVLAGLALAGLLGCVHQQTPPAPPPASTPVAPGPGASAPPSPAPAATAAPSPAASSVPTPAAPAAAPRPVQAPAPGHAPSAGSGGSAPAVTAHAAAAPASSAPRTATVTAAAPAASAGPALDLTSLEQRLRDTHAIGLFTKLSLKNQVDDLLAQFRALYAGQGRLTLAGLRRSYELLLMKVVTLLQDDDPGLAGAVSSSREAIWAILSDRNRFNNL